MDYAAGKVMKYTGNQPPYPVIDLQAEPVDTRFRSDAVPNLTTDILGQYSEAAAWESALSYREIRKGVNNSENLEVLTNQLQWILGYMSQNPEEFCGDGLKDFEEEEEQIGGEEDEMDEVLGLPVRDPNNPMEKLAPSRSEEEWWQRVEQTNELDREDEQFHKYRPEGAPWEELEAVEQEKWKRRAEISSRTRWDAMTPEQKWTHSKRGREKFRQVPWCEGSDQAQNFQTEYEKAQEELNALDPDTANQIYQVVFKYDAKTCKEEEDKLSIGKLVKVYEKPTTGAGMNNAWDPDMKNPNASQMSPTEQSLLKLWAEEDTQQKWGTKTMDPKVMQEYKNKAVEANRVKWDDLTDEQKKAAVDKGRYAMLREQSPAQYDQRVREDEQKYEDEQDKKQELSILVSQIKKKKERERQQALGKQDLQDRQVSEELEQKQVEEEALRIYTERKQVQQREKERQEWKANNSKKPKTWRERAFGSKEEKAEKARMRREKQVEKLRKKEAKQAEMLGQSQGPMDDFVKQVNEENVETETIATEVDIVNSGPNSKAVAKGSGSKSSLNSASKLQQIQQHINNLPKFTNSNNLSTANTNSNDPSLSVTTNASEAATLVTNTKDPTKRLSNSNADTAITQHHLDILNRAKKAITKSKTDYYNDEYLFNQQQRASEIEKEVHAYKVWAESKVKEMQWKDRQNEFAEKMAKQDYIDKLKKRLRKERGVKVLENSNSKGKNSNTITQSITDHLSDEDIKILLKPEKELTVAEKAKLQNFVPYDNNISEFWKKTLNLPDNTLQERYANRKAQRINDIEDIIPKSSSQDSFQYKDLQRVQYYNQKSTQISRFLDDLQLAHARANLECRQIAIEREEYGQQYDIGRGNGGRGLEVGSVCDSDWLQNGPQSDSKRMRQSQSNQQSQQSQSYKLLKREVITNSGSELGQQWQNKNPNSDGTDRIRWKVKKVNSFPEYDEATNSTSSTTDESDTVYTIPQPALHHCRHPNYLQCQRSNLQTLDQLSHNVLQFEHRAFVSDFLGAGFFQSIRDAVVKYDVQRMMKKKRKEIIKQRQEEMEQKMNKVIEEEVQQEDSEEVQDQVQQQEDNDSEEPSDANISEVPANDNDKCKPLTDLADYIYPTNEEVLKQIPKEEQSAAFNFQNWYEGVFGSSGLPNNVNNNVNNKHHRKSWSSKSISNSYGNSFIMGVNEILKELPTIATGGRGSSYGVNMMMQ